MDNRANLVVSVMGSCCSRGESSPKNDEVEMTEDLLVEAYDVIAFHNIETCNPQAMTKLMLRIPNNYSQYAADCLVVFFQSRNKLDQLLCFIVESEAQATNGDGNMFLRTPTIGTRILQKIFHLLGGDLYMRALLLDRLQDVVFAPVDFEINPTKLMSRGVLDAENLRNTVQINLENLTNFCASLLEELIMVVKVSHVNSPSKIGAQPPAILFRIAFLISTCINKYAPNYEPWLAVSAFLFLRTICPALLSPNNFSSNANVIIPKDTPVSQTARRNLVLVTKCIQNVSTGNRQGEKEGFMRGTNVLIERYHSSVKNLLHYLMDPSNCLDFSDSRGYQSLYERLPPEPLKRVETATSFLKKCAQGSVNSKVPKSQKDRINKRLMKIN